MSKEQRPSFIENNVWGDPIIFVASEPPRRRDWWKVLTGRYEDPQVTRIVPVWEGAGSALFGSAVSGGMSLPKRQEGEHPAVTAIKEGIAEEGTVHRTNFDDIELDVTIAGEYRKHLLDETSE